MMTEHNDTQQNTINTNTRSLQKIEGVSIGVGHTFII